MAVHRHNLMMSQGIFMMQKLYFDSINHTLIAEKEKKIIVKGEKNRVDRKKKSNL